MVNRYKTLFDKYTFESRRLNREFNMLAFARLLSVASFLITTWFCISQFSLMLLLFASLSLIVFLFLMKKQDSIRYRLDLTKALKEINRNEMDFLKFGKSAFDNGSSFLPEKHPNAGDLDLFG